MEGNILQKLFSSMWYIRGNHTVTTEGELLYTNYSKNTVYRVTTCSNISVRKLIETGNWKPGAIYFSHIYGHILVGMGTILDEKITRYNREGRKLQDIQCDNEGQTLYQRVHFITENINGDICTADSSASKVVVVTASGKYRFSYSGHHSQLLFCPYGICTNVLGHILVCNNYFMYNTRYSSVHLLDIDGQFLSLLLTPKQCSPYPCVLCIDNQHNLWVGGWYSSTVSVYKYLQKTEN
ncbi:uncharacterized protein LOC133180617 [Saccostrea echinata]|uniref:uncharacterized protein LOC133180617 n=1 Tax=Saccostrea echinata TaxID=191078 RepID=UPI002A80C29D|nr:uncharacterized protein LOC133180617 [Saccostrea echinata]